MEVAAERNQYGALLEPIIYRDAEIACMYLVEDIEGMQALTSNVPPYTVEDPDAVNQPMVTPKKGGSVFKVERKSDFESGVYLSSIKKVRKFPDFPNAKNKVQLMIDIEGVEGEKDSFVHWQTMYILRCLETSCTSTSLYFGLDHYDSTLVNNILRNDLKYYGEEVMKNKVNLLTICERFLCEFNATI